MQRCANLDPLGTKYLTKTMIHASFSSVSLLLWCAQLFKWSVSEIRENVFLDWSPPFFLVIITYNYNYLSLAIALERKRYLSKCEKI